MEHDNLSIIGTSHIAKQSILQIKEAFAGRLPDIVAIELDPGRLNALLQKGEAKLGISSIWRIGLKGYLFALLGSIMQKRLGRLVGIKPGSDMLTAYRLAKRHKLKIVFIDRDIRITLRRLSQSLTWKERWHFLADVFNGIFFGKRELKKLGLDRLDLTKVPEKTLIKKLVKRVKERYPNVYNVIIAERDEFMANNLAHIMGIDKGMRILALVGAGHEEELLRLVREKGKGDIIRYSLSVGN